MIKKLLFSVLTVIGTFFVLMRCGVIWTSPRYYSVKEIPTIASPVMTMQEYDKVNAHPRPYIYMVNSKKGGKAFILGIEHTKDNHNIQLDTIRAIWEKANPTTTLVEGRLGFLFSWVQDPVTQYGEGGLVASLAREKGVDLYTWEPSRDEELKIMVEKFSPEKLAMFYSLRPYFSNMRNGKPSNPESKLQGYIDDRTDYDLIRGKITSWKQIDKQWKKDFPNEKDWRDFSDEYGWPKGYLFDIWNESNITRDIHLCNTVINLLNEGKVVFVTMGSSHAVRIENTLKDTLGK